MKAGKRKGAEQIGRHQPLRKHGLASRTSD
jgi:hypothetical protein